MKQLLKIALAYVLMTSVSNVANAYDFIVDGICYNITSHGTCEVCNKGKVLGIQKKYKGNVVIPNIIKHKGKKFSVTSIGEKAFMDCEDLKSITLPNTISKIKIDAFYGCQIKRVNIPTLEDWLKIDFQNEKSNPLKHGQLYIKKDGSYANEGSIVINLIIPSSITEIPNYAFSNYHALVSVEFPKELKHIRSNAFNGCSHLLDVTFSEGLLSIEDYAFANCSSLSSLTFPNSLSKIGEQSFANCGLKTIIFPKSFSGLQMESNSFANCYLDKVTSKYDNVFIETFSHNNHIPTFYTYKEPPKLPKVVKDVSSTTIKSGYPTPNWSENITDEKKEVLTRLINNLVKVQGGSFTMGNPKSRTQKVTLSSFYIGKFEVTEEEWETVMGRVIRYDNNASKYKAVEGVSWSDCQEFLYRLNQMTGLSFSLPTEAEWEYAARGGNKSRGYKYSGSDELHDVALTKGKYAAVGGKMKANELGLYDMSGNAWEWTRDLFGAYSSEPVNNPTGAYGGRAHVYRGGGVRHNYTSDFTVYARNHKTPDGYNFNIGLRVVLREFRLTENGPSANEVRSWIQGKWYLKDYGVECIMYISENYIEVYHNGQLDYSGPYTIDLNNNELRYSLPSGGDTVLYLDLRQQKIATSKLGASYGTAFRKV